MWWRNSLRIVAVVAVGALNAACFQPLYASRSFNGEKPVGAALAQVQIERIDAPNGKPESRIAVELQEALKFEINGTEGLISPTHVLKVRMNVGRSSIMTDITTGRVLAEITGIDASFVLTELSTGKVVMRGSTTSRVSSDYPGQQQRFARVRARLDAENRAAKVIAENVRTRVASYFVAGT
jgi:LPS-assembly lipoprotein